MCLSVACQFSNRIACAGPYIMHNHNYPSDFNFSIQIYYMQMSVAMKIHFVDAVHKRQRDDNSYE